MHATPFNLPDTEAKSEFRKQLHLIFSENKITAEKILPTWSANDQISHQMVQIRNLPLGDRMTCYIERRVDEQRSWYARKATMNRKDARFWVIVGCIAYIVAVVFTLSHIAIPDWQYWPIEPVIVLAASLVGWTQIKKFNELAAAYTVTAHEIGLIRPMVESVMTESDFSEFVNDAEKAFSREHTLWIARKSD